MHTLFSRVEGRCDGSAKGVSRRETLARMLSIEEEEKKKKKKKKKKKRLLLQYK